CTPVDRLKSSSFKAWTVSYLIGPLWRIHDFRKRSIQELMASHLARGQKLLNLGMIQEAIAEYEKDHTRAIRSSIDAEIVQKSYVLKGRAYRQLGDNEKAISAFLQARDLLKHYRVGSGPETELAEIFIEQGRFDDAIDLCREVLTRASNWNAQQVLEKAVALKKNGRI
ncbi:MAG: tetratricopeptide repeat protein, partial [Thermoflexales bacterium]|nr:tetratricopeptide repeat protein [Thermoflexales bacterium]